MTNYMGIKFNAAADEYGAAAFLNNTIPDFMVETNSHEAGLNISDPEVDAMSSIEPRGAYPEPEGTVNVYPHIKAVPTFLYALLGNYRYTANGATITVDGEPVTRNVHEFWLGENSELPQWGGLFTYGDFMYKQVRGGIMDSMTWKASLEKTEADFDFKYKREFSKQVNIETARQGYTLNTGLPLMGYDYSVNLTVVEDDTLTYNCFKNAEIKVENNLLAGDDIRCLGRRFYTLPPTSEEKKVEVDLTTKFDRRNYELITAAIYGNTNVAEGYHSLEECKHFTARATIFARSCIDTTESITFNFPRNIINVDTVSAEGNNIEANMKLFPINTGTVTMLDGTTHLKTPMYVKVVSSEGRVQ